MALGRRDGNGADKQASALPAEVGTARVVPVIGSGLYKAREFVNNDWVIHAPSDLRLEDLDKPRVWESSPAELQSFDRLWVFGSDWWAEVLIRQYIHGSVCQPLILRSGSLPAPDADNSDKLYDDYEFTHSPQDGWVVTRKRDRVVMGTGREKRWFKRSDAEAYIRNHASTRGT